MTRLNLVCMALHLQQTKLNVFSEFDLYNFRPGDHYNILLKMDGITLSTFI